MINIENPDVLCIYLNAIANVLRLIEWYKKSLNSNQKPNKVAFILNIGKSRNDTFTFLGSDARPGSHWTLCTYSNSNNKLVNCFCFHTVKLQTGGPKTLL